MVFIILILLSFSIVLFSFFQKRNEPLEMKKNEIDNIFDNGEYIIAIIEYNKILKKINRKQMKLLRQEIIDKIIKCVFLIFEFNTQENKSEDIRKHLSLIKDRKIKNKDKDILCKMIKAEELNENKEYISTINIYKTLLNKMSIMKWKSLNAVIYFKIAKIYFKIRDNTNESVNKNYALESIKMAEKLSYNRSPELYFEITMYYINNIISNDDFDNIFKQIVNSEWCWSKIEKEKLEILFKIKRNCFKERKKRSIELLERKQNWRKESISYEMDDEEWREKNRWLWDR